MDTNTILSEDFLNITDESKPGKRLLKSPEASKKEQIADAKFEKKLKKLTKKKIGFTNTLAVYLVLLLTLTLGLGFYLALESIRAQYTGALICWTAVLSPLDACLGVVLMKIVDKSKAENISNGTGISYALAMAENKSTDSIKYENSEAFKKAMKDAISYAKSEANANTGSNDISSATSESTVYDPEEDMTGGENYTDSAAIDSPAI